MQMASFYPKEKTSKKQMNFFFILILIFTQIKFCYLSSCIVHDNFNTESCFNDIIIINNKDYRAGQIQVNNNNDLIIEFSDNKSPYDSRLFFSLKENGRGFYANEEIRKEITLSSDKYFHDNEHDITYHVIGRYESINQFISLKGDTNKQKQYLFSISAFASLTELHDIENDTYQQWVTTDFLGIDDEHRYIFSYKYSLFEWSNSNIYFLAYVQYSGTNEKKEDYSTSYTLSRFYFEKDNSDNKIKVKDLSKKEDEVNYDNRVVSAVYVEKYNIIVVCFVKKDVEKLTLKFYNYDLSSINDYEYEKINNP